MPVYSMSILIPPGVLATGVLATGALATGALVTGALVNSTSGGGIGAIVAKL
jgi:hypothetical protein